MAMATSAAAASAARGPSPSPAPGTGSESTGITPRTFPAAPYAYDVCTGPNADGTVSETHVDTCLVYLAGGGGSFLAGDHLQIAEGASVEGALVVSCSGSSVAAATMDSTANMCDFTFTTGASGAGVPIGIAQYYVPDTVPPNTTIGQVAFYCSVAQQGVQRLCPVAPVTIDVRGPGARVIDEIPPTFVIVPPDLTLDATSPAGAVVAYLAPTATDNAPGPIAIVCSPSSGATFSVGSTLVTCTATDASGNAARTTFTVVVQNTSNPQCRPARTVASLADAVARSLCVTADGDAIAPATSDALS
jgi:hypothetical protein